jgi:hypothetical protein
MTIDDKSHTLSKSMSRDLSKAFQVELDTPLREEQARIVMYIESFCNARDKLDRIQAITDE